VCYVFLGVSVVRVQNCDLKAPPPPKAFQATLIPVFVKNTNTKEMLKPCVISNLGLSLHQVCDEIFVALGAQNKALEGQLILDGVRIADKDFDKPAYYFADKKHWLFEVFQGLFLLSFLMLIFDTKDVFRISF